MMEGGWGGRAPAGRERHSAADHSRLYRTPPPERFPLLAGRDGLGSSWHPSCCPPNGMDIRELMFATDFSPASEAAGKVARDMALEMGARLHLVHVVPPATDPAPGAVQLTALAKGLGKSLAVETALLSGRAAREIRAFARDKHVDLIVIGTHGRTGMSRRLLGSVAEVVVRLAPCLVLTVPAQSAPGVRAAAQVEAALPIIHRCVVCAGETDDLICELCRDRIRGEALEWKIGAERW
jgi:nucleotide-binding universal stress UspA family protein